MNSGRQRETRTARKAAQLVRLPREGELQPEIHRYFPTVQGAGLEPGSERGKANVLLQPRETTPMQPAQGQMAVRTSVEALQTIPQSPRTLAAVAGATPMIPLPGEKEAAGLKMEDLKTLIQALPTRADIETLIGKVEDAHRKELELVRGELQILVERVTDGESAYQSLEQRVSILERDSYTQKETSVALQLQLEDLEDRSRRNNVRLRGIPEALDQENLQDMVKSIFENILKDAMPLNLELDRVHRALGPKSKDINRPRDVVCRLHYFAHREAILRKAWETGTIDFKGGQVKILPDLSRATLQRRTLLRPLLERV